MTRENIFYVPVTPPPENLPVKSCKYVKGVPFVGKVYERSIILSKMTYKRIKGCISGQSPSVLLVFSVTSFKMDQNKKIKTIRHIESRIWEMKGSKYTKTLARIWVEGIIRIRDTRGNVLPQFIELCMETPCWSSSG